MGKLIAVQIQDRQIWMESTEEVQFAAKVPDLTSLGEVQEIRIENLVLPKAGGKAGEKTGAARKGAGILGVIPSLPDAAQEFMETIRAYCDLVLDTFSTEVVRPPDKVTAEFGLGVSGEGNIYVVKTGVQATVKVSMEWNLAKGTA